MAFGGHVEHDTAANDLGFNRPAVRELDHSELDESMMPV